VVIVAMEIINISVNRPALHSIRYQTN
jgi:hypothetical protein